MTESNKHRLRVITIAALILLMGSVDSILLSWGM